MEERSLRDQVPVWVKQLRECASASPAGGACAVGTAMDLWAWTFDRLHRGPEKDSIDNEAIDLALADALGGLLAARALVLDVAAREGGQPGSRLTVDLCHAHVVRTCGEVARVCAEIVFGSLRHPAWETDSGNCYHAADLDALEEYVPGLASCARAYSDVIEADGSHPAKAGPCVRFDGLDEFVQLRTRLDGCLAGGFTARRRAARALSAAVGDPAGRQG